MKKISLILGILLVLSFINTAYSQTEVQRKIFYPTFLSVVEYRAWQKETGDSKQSVSQLNSPIAIKLPLSRNFAVDVAGSYIFSSVEDSRLSGLTDVRARAVTMLFNDTLMLNAGVNIPNGKSDLDFEETAVSAILSDQALGFRYNRLGEGLDMTFGGGLAQAYGPASFGIGAGYIIKGEYEIAQDVELKYKPGNQLNITGGFDLLFAPMLLRSDVTYTTYKYDQSDSDDIFREGNRLAIKESAIVKNPAFALVVSGRYISRAKSEIVSQNSRNSSFYDPEIEKKKIRGNQIDANALISLFVAKGVSIKFLGESTIIGKNDDKKNSASVFGFGGGLTVSSSKGSSFDLTGRYYIGSSNDGDTNLKGFSATSSIRIIF